MPMSTSESTLIAPADVNAETKIGHVIESSICGRCGGSGRMPFSVANGVCFKCYGRGTVDTKRGAAARAFYRQLVQTPVEGLRAGDRILSEGIPGITASRWVTVEGIFDNAAVAAEAGSYDAALKACGSCSLLEDAEKIEQAIEAGATVYPREEGKAAVFTGTRIEAVAKDGERHSLGGSRPVLAKIDPLVNRAILRTVAEYQAALTKTGKPRKGSRWATA